MSGASSFYYTGNNFSFPVEGSHPSHILKHCLQNKKVEFYILFQLWIINIDITNAQPSCSCRHLAFGCSLTMVINQKCFFLQFLFFSAFCFSIQRWTIKSTRFTSHMWTEMEISMKNPCGKNMCIDKFHWKPLPNNSSRGQNTDNKQSAFTWK